MANLKVDVVTPGGLVYEKEAELVVARTVDGDIGVLPNHAPIIVPLAIDEVRVKKERDGNEQDYIAVNGGIMEVRDNVVSIIADSAELARDIDLSRAERAKERAEAKIQEAKQTQNQDELKRAEVALSRAINRINVSNK